MSSGDVLCLDVGTVRIGIARANNIAKIAEPVSTIANNDQASKVIVNTCNALNAQLLVVGLPQNSNGEDTKQTAYTRQFIKDLQEYDKFMPPVVFHDEALSSKKAEQFLKKNLNNNSYQTAGVDAVAAMFILQDYLDSTTYTNTYKDVA
jgi:putative holliday junction resolvase